MSGDTSTVVEYKITSYTCDDKRVMLLQSVQTTHDERAKDRYVQEFANKAGEMGLYAYVRVDAQRITRESLDTTIIDLRPSWAQVDT